jgi:Signal transduction histidine kinase
MVGERGARLPRWTVRARILAAILLVTAVGLGLTGTVTFLVQRELVVRGVDAELRRQLEAARGIVALGADGAETSRQALAAILAAIPPPANGSAVGIVDGRRALVPGTEVAFEIDDALAERAVREVSDGSVRMGTVVRGGDEVRYIATPVLVAGAEDEGVYLVAIDVGRELEPTSRGFTVFVAAAGGSLVAVGIAGWLVAGRLLRPVRALRSTAERITASDLRERIPVEGNDDLSRLTETVNDMLDRLDTALRNQRELLDDVRHELRAPLTIVRGHLELVDPSNPADVREAIAIATDEVDRMAELVEGLTALAEVRATVLDPQELELERLTRDVGALASALPGHHWVVSATGDGMLRADRRRVTQALLQLADNAAKYAPEGTVVELGSRGDADAVELWVRDHGPGVPESERERIFERFARADRSARGSGLGLAIVHDIARAHGGDVRVEDAAPGARFVMRLPRGGPS